MIEYREDEIKRLIVERRNDNSEFADYAAHLLFNAEAYAA